MRLGNLAAIGWFVTTLVLANAPGAEEHASSEDPRTVTLESSLHFSGAGGDAVVVPAGAYRAEAAGADALRLVPVAGGTDVAIAATATRHEEEVEAPVALLVEAEASLVLVMLLLPGGEALQAAGSPSGVVPRGRTLPSASQLRVNQQLRDRLRKASKNMRCVSDRIDVNLTHRPLLVVGGNEVRLTVSLSCVPSTETLVQLISSDIALIPVPQPNGNLTIPAGRGVATYSPVVGNPPNNADVRIRAVLPFVGGSRSETTVSLIPQ